jgi:succinate dehydrogenase/fumarate reductase flavoprotein subunit
VEVFVDRAHQAVAFLEDVTPLELVSCMSFSDYHADLPGGKPGARSLEPAPFPARDMLGEWDDRVRRSPHLPPVTFAELAGAGLQADPKNVSVVDTPAAGGAGAPGAHIIEAITTRLGLGHRTMGGALAASLVRGALDQGVTITTSTRAERLLMKDGEVVGVVAEGPDGPVRVGARRGVVLAAGGFEWNAELVKAFLPVPEVWPLSPPHNKGDGLLMGIDVGAAIGNMSVAWAYTCTGDGESTFEGEPLQTLGTPRQEPGVIAINRNGQRFVNEATSYHVMPLAHAAYDSRTQTWANLAPSWLLFDQTVRDRIVVGTLQPGEPTPAWVHEAATIEELAGRVGVPADALAQTVERWNAHVARGEDPDFGRGTVWFEGWTTGGPTGAGMLAPVDRGPYYAMPLLHGVNGTAGGLRIDEHGRVLALRGGVISGLYAAGNTTASVFGPAYPGGGATIGPALTFGHLAGLHVAESARREAVDAERAAPCKSDYHMHRMARGVTS